MRDVAQLVAADVMTRSPVCTHPGADLADVEQLLIEHRISGLPVVDQEKLVGIVSRSDIARMGALTRSLDGLVSDRLNWDQQADGFQHAAEPEYTGFHQRLEKLKARDAMSDHVVTCVPTTPIVDVATEMVQHHIHRVIVVEGSRAVGIVSTLDIVRLIAREQPTAKPSHS